MDFKMPGKVYKTAMSSLARSHMLIAAGTEDVQVRLCDIMSGAFAHTLSGHRGMLYHEIFGFFFLIFLLNICMEKEIKLMKSILLQNHIMWRERQ